MVFPPDSEPPNSDQSPMRSRQEFSSPSRRSDDWIVILILWAILGSAAGWLFSGGFFTPTEETITQHSDSNSQSSEFPFTTRPSSTAPIEVPEPQVPNSEDMTALPILRQALSFVDVPGGYWAKPYIDALTERGILSGLPDGTYAPDRPMTRAELAVQLAHAFEIEAASATKSFQDVPDEYWGKLAIDEAVSTGFMTGYPDDVFRPNQTVSRLEVLIALATGLSLSQRQASDRLLEQYSDQSAIPTWARDKVAATIAVGILNESSVPNDKLRPREQATRAEVAALIYNALVYMGKVQPIE